MQNTSQNFIDQHKSKEEVCEIANDNATGQVIISGNKEYVNIIQNKFCPDLLVLIFIRVWIIHNARRSLVRSPARYFLPQSYSDTGW